MIGCHNTTLKSCMNEVVWHKQDPSPVADTGVRQWGGGGGGEVILEGRHIL